MSRLHPALAAGLALDMRNPLARIELAASQLERAALTPAAREQVDSIADAVCELDRLIARSLAVLLPRDPAPTGDVRAELADLRARLRSSLGTRGVVWLEPGESSRTVGGDPFLARQAALLLVRLASGLAVDGGRFALDASVEGEGFGLVLRVLSEADPEPAQLEPADDFAGIHGALFETRTGEAGFEARLSFRAPEAACVR